MREIKFRGKTTDGVWVYGSFFDHGEYAVIYDPTDKTYYQCYLESMGQFTGLRDKNGVEIYEGDIVDVLTLGINYRSDHINGVVKSIDGCFTVEFSQPVYDVTLKTMRSSLYVKCFTINRAIKVIGNMHDNSELLEAER